MTRTKRPEGAKITMALCRLVSINEVSERVKVEKSFQSCGIQLVHAVISTKMDSETPKGRVFCYAGLLKNPNKSLGICSRCSRQLRSKNVFFFFQLGNKYD